MPHRNRNTRGSSAMGPGEREGLVTLTPDDLPGTRAYHLLNALVVPRPIAWVSSRAPDGVPNLAPHSYFTVLSTRPPILGFVSVGEKDTLTKPRIGGRV